MVPLSAFPTIFDNVPTKGRFGLPNVARLAPLAVLILLGGCAPGGFGRFMDHPILSWLPLDRWGIVKSDRITTSAAPQFPDKQCFALAKERTEFLDQSEYSDEDLQKIFALTYHDCVMMERSR